MTDSPVPAAPRRRRSASRQAGPPTAVPAPAEDPAPVEVPVPAEVARAVTPSDDRPADDDDTSSDTGTDDAGTDPVDPVERSDRRRRRRQKAKRTRAERDTSGASSPAITGTAPPVEPAARSSSSKSAGRPTDADRRRSGSERALRALEGGRDTQISTTDAMRAREWATPTAEDLAEADRDLVLVRRNYQPPAPLQTTRRRGGPADRPAPEEPGAPPAR